VRVYTRRTWRPGTGRRQHTARRQARAAAALRGPPEAGRTVETLGVYLQRFDHLDTGRFALKAAEEATALKEVKEDNDLETNVIVSPSRSTAVDLLRASGMERAEVR